MDQRFAYNGFPLNLCDPAGMLFDRRGQIAVADTVYVAWSEHRGHVGMVRWVNQDATVARLDTGDYRTFSLWKVLTEMPTFDTTEEFESWVARAGEQEYFPGDIVKVADSLKTTKTVPGKVVRYLGIEGNDPPKYVVTVVHHEPKILPAYFLRGLA